MTHTVEVLKTFILGLLLSLLIVAAFLPESFGRWLQKIDTGRYEFVDCDCSEAIEDAVFYVMEQNP